MMLKIFTILVTFLFILPRPVEAYLDPGTGSYLFQFVIAGLLGSLFFFRGYFDKIKNKLSGKKEEKKKEEQKEVKEAKKNEKTSKTNRSKK